MLHELQIAVAEQMIKTTALQLDTAELKTRMGNVEESLEKVIDYSSGIDRQLSDHIHVTEKRLTALEK